MSYILEALRKADAERERGSVPDLNAQWLPGAPAEDETEPRSAPRWLWPVLAVATVSVAVAAWRFFSSEAPPPALAPTPAVSAKPVPPPLPNPSAPAQAAVAAAAAIPAAKVEPSRTDPVPQAKLAPRAEPTAPAPPRPADAKTVAKTAVPVPLSMPVPAQAPPTTERVPKLHELPEELRRQLPPLAVGGSVYSPQAERRMVVINGQVFLEGATLAPELMLVQIRPKVAVLSIRGQRFELPL